MLAPRRDLQLEPLVEVLEGKRLAHVHAYRADEMLMLMRLAEEFGFKVATFEHGLEGYKVAKEMAAHGAGVGTFSDWWGYKIEAIDAIPYNAALMTEGRRRRVDQLRQRRARAPAQHRGGQDDELGRPHRGRGAGALSRSTRRSSSAIDKRVGSIEVGKDADLVDLERATRSAATPW